jgi:hypothetical protein
MKKSVLIGLTMAIALGASAEGPQKAIPVAAGDKAPVAKVVSTTKLSKDVVLRKRQSGNLSDKALTINNLKRLPINQSANRLSLRGVKETTSGFFEGFEGSDGNREWLPENWYILSKDETTSCPWYVGKADSYYTVYDGVYAAMINYDEEHTDEFLVTPAFTVLPNDVLSYMYYDMPLYYFSLDNIDWDTYEYSGDKVQVMTFRILITEDDGATWTTLKDYADDYVDYDFYQLYYSEGWKETAISLSQYSGKQVRIAFEYEGTDGGVCMVDNVSVMPKTLTPSYSVPTFTLYSGVNRGYFYETTSIAMEPVFSTVKWTNTTSDSDDLSFTWTYDNETVGEFNTAYSKDLEVIYHPTHRKTGDYFFYQAPVLKASAEGFTDGEYTRQYVQAGGRPDFEYEEEEDLYEYGYSAYDIYNEGLEYVRYTNTDAMPFGCSERSDKYWTEYSFPDPDDQVDGNYAYVDGIMNIYQPSESPLVIKGGWVHAVTLNLNPEHEYTLEIIPLTEEGALGQPLATAKSSEIQVDPLTDFGDGSSAVAVLFNFDNPVVMSRDVCDQYVVRFTGIHGCGDYFEPVKSLYDNPDGLYVGAVQKVVSWMNNPQTSLTMLARLLGKRVAFSIMLDAEYPWLQGDDEVSLENNVGTLALDSFYSGEDITVTAPEWLSVSITGVDEDCMATFTVTGEPDADQAKVTLSVPGIDKVVTVKNARDSIDSLRISGDKTVKEYMTLSGISLGADTPVVGGIYLVRFTDGTIAKAVIK